VLVCQYAYLETSFAALFPPTMLTTSRRYCNNKVGTVVG